MAKPNGKLLVGTAKGAFILDRLKGKWHLNGPHFAGRSVYAVMLDKRAGRNRIWAAATSWHFGAELVFSDDGGKTWDMPEEMRIKFPEDTEKSLENIWQIAAGADDDTLYVGVAPAAIFESPDNGATWSLNRGLWDHPHREQWTTRLWRTCRSYDNHRHGRTGQFEDRHFDRRRLSIVGRRCELERN